MMSTSTDGDGGSSTSSSGSIGSSEQSSGYGSQNAIVKPFSSDAKAGNASAMVAIKPLQKSEPAGKGLTTLPSFPSRFLSLCLLSVMHGQITLPTYIRSLTRVYIPRVLK